ncbi:uncharacterized protein EAE97_008271 [Botrytis byssoidea]|uniref:Uncharacterized protein n=1 Tax=Botrytis byssoidea TaxID=139641 RepID=A0A9P5IGG2_9HELO|nr:uncharacterized protein EAE97_008271 [Botrytis byssoidea]KAF7935364.1 hypothetical protein EAE97_008271 [Botrytis byssoidea]
MYSGALPCSRKPNKQAQENKQASKPALINSRQGVSNGAHESVFHLSVAIASWARPFHKFPTRIYLEPRFITEEAPGTSALSRYQDTNSCEENNSNNLILRSDLLANVAHRITIYRHKRRVWLLSREPYTYRSSDPLQLVH